MENIWDFFYRIFSLSRKEHILQDRPVMLYLEGAWKVGRDETIFPAYLRTYAPIIWPRTTKFGKVTRGRGFSMGQPRPGPIPRGGAPASRKIFETPTYTRMV